MSVVKGVKRIARSVTWCKATGFVAAYYTAREPDQRKTWRALYADIHAAKYNTGTRRRHCHAAKSTCSRPILSTSLLIRIRPPIVSDASTDGTSVPCSLAQNVGWQHEFKIYRVAQKVGRKFVHIVAKYWPNFNFFSPAYSAENLNKVVTKHAITFWLCLYTTLWNMWIGINLYLRYPDRP